jgi:ABC-type nitrate/sulfonate/bicarbonate transport system substrate-binding protein
MTERLVAGFVPLVDCAVLIAARERGFAAAEGIDLALVREPSWASLRDHLLLGHVDCAHALAPLPVALTLGVGGIQADCIVPFVLNRGGNAITLSASLADAVRAVGSFDDGGSASRVGEALARVAREREAPLTFAMVFPFSNHNFDLRYWLAASGLHPDRDVRLVAIPPPLMVDSLRAGVVDGFCVGEPWNSVAVSQGLGEIVVTQSQLAPRSAEKVLALRAEFAERSPDVLERLLRALDAAAAWVDDSAHRVVLAECLARPEYLGVAPELIAPALAGRLRLGTGRSIEDRDFLYFGRDGANVPDPAIGLWSYAQMVRWGQVSPSAQRERAAGRVLRGDLYRRALGREPVESPPLVPFDGIAFASSDVSDYLAQFELGTPFAALSGT